MKLAALAVAVLVVGCSRSSGSPAGPLLVDAAPPPAPVATLVAPQAGDAAPPEPDAPIDAAAPPGLPYGLRVDGEAVTYCDGRGGRRLDPATGQSTPFARPCPPDEEADGACGNVPKALDVDVRSPQDTPDDIVGAGSENYPLSGRLHDCAALGSTLAVVTRSRVSLLADGKEQVIARRGAERVALGAKWVAWIDGSKVLAKAR